MTKAELKNKYTERAKIFQQAMESCHSSSPMNCIEWFADRIAELEAQIEKMRNYQNCDYQLHIVDCPIFKSGGHISCKKCPHWTLQKVKENT